MAKDLHSSKIWRTVVFAGAMLATPAVASAGGAAAPAPAPPPVTAAKPVQAKPDPAIEKQDKIKTLDGERNALLAKLVETDVKELDKLKKDIVAKDAAIKKLVDEILVLRKPRIRTPPLVKPVGRGFVLA